MPQIPVFEQSQRLEPSAPVSAVSSESARDMGEAQSFMGKALFDLGNKLDEVNKRAKTQEDALTTKRLVAQFERESLKYKADQDAQPIFKDDATGQLAVEDFGARLDEMRLQFVEKVGSETVKKMFMAETEETIKGLQVSALASEVKKREEQIPLLRMGLLNDLASVARADARKGVIQMMRADEAIMEDDGIPMPMKTKMIQDAKAHIGAEAVEGLLDQARKTGNVDGFFTAKKYVNERLAEVLTKDQKLKLEAHIDSSRKEYFATSWQILQQTQAMDDASRKSKQSKAEFEYNQRLAAAGADQFKIDAINNQIKKDPNISDESVRRTLLKVSEYSEQSNDAFESRFMERFYSTKYTTEGLLREVRSAFIDGQINRQRWMDLQGKINSRQNQLRDNPEISKLVKAGEDTIKAQFGVNIFEPDTMLYKSEQGKQAAQAINRYHQGLFREYEKGITPGGIEAVRNSVLKGYNLIETKPVKGLGPGSFESGKNATKSLEQLAEIRRNKEKWGAMTAKEKKEFNKQLAIAAENKKKVESKEKLENLINKPSGSGKIKGEE